MGCLMTLLNFILQHVEPDIICNAMDICISITHLPLNLAWFTCLGYCAAAHTPLEHNIHICHSSWLPIFSYCSPALTALARCPVAVKFINTRRIREIRFPLRCPLRLEALLTRRIFRHYLCHLSPLAPVLAPSSLRGSPAIDFFLALCMLCFAVGLFILENGRHCVRRVVLARTRLDSSRGRSSSGSGSGSGSSALGIIVKC